jgi:hypothetical protein
MHFSLRIAVAATAAVFAGLAPVAAAPDVARITVANGCTTAPLLAVQHHAFVAARIDGVAGYAFALDTGAAAFMTTGTAHERALAPTPYRASAFGIGGGAVETRFVIPEDVTVAGLDLHRASFATGDFGGVEPLAPHGMRFAGLLGREIFTRYVTTFDRDAGTVRFCRNDEASFPAWPFVALDRSHGNPRLTARVDGVAGSYDFDTGSQLAILTARRTPPAPASVVDALIGRGIDGPLRGDVARARTLGIGTFVVREPLAFAAAVARGPLTEDAGNLGDRIWERFDLVVDFANARLYLREASTFGDPMIYDRAGMTVELRNGLLTIANVDAAAPAAQAGLQAGDVVTGFDGRPTDADTPLALAAAQVGPIGASLALDVVRKGMPLTVTVFLTDLV